MARQIWVEIDRGEGLGIETRSVSGTKEEVEEALGFWTRTYGAENVTVVYEEGK